jgi:serine protease
MKEIRRSAFTTYLALASALLFTLPTLAAPAGPPSGVDRFVVRFKEGSAEQASKSLRQHVLDDAGHRQGLRVNQLRRMALGADVIRVDHKLDAQAARNFMDRLLRDPRVAFAVIDQPMYPALVPNDPLYSEQWQYSDPRYGINLPTAWDSTSGTGQIVAVLDTGVVYHSDLSPNLVAGYDFVSDPLSGGDGDGRDADASDPGDWVAADECEPGSNARSSSWHGTHVAGTIAAVTNNGKGVAGVAYGARIQPVRVLGKCFNPTSDVVDAIVWASGGSVPGVPSNPTPAKVINLSLGGAGVCDALFQGAIDAAGANGASVVVAAGNNGHDAAGYQPASCNNVIAVAALDEFGDRALYSNYGATIDIAAPGNSILSTVNAGTTVPAAESYADYAGTSMAAPHVSGVAALVRAKAGNSITPAQVKSLLEATARTFAAPCDGGCGAGVLDAGAAVAAAGTSRLRVTDAVTTVEGNSGTHTVSFSVSLTQALSVPVTFNVATANGTATAGSDYVALSAPNQTIPAGQTSKTFNVTVNGDVLGEGDEYFFLNLTNVVGAGVLDAQGKHTIYEDDPVPLLDGVPVPNLSGRFGQPRYFQFDVPAGETNLRFDITGGVGEADLLVRFGALPDRQTYDCGPGYQGNVENCTIATPQAGRYYVMVDAFFPFDGVTLTAAYGNPMPELTISDASIVEGDDSEVWMTFTVTLAKPTNLPVGFDYSFTDGTATTADFDYLPYDAHGSINPGELSMTFVTAILSDRRIEPNETLYATLSNVTNATVVDGQGVGTIIDDDTITLSIADASVSEGNSGTKQMAFPVSISKATDHYVTVNLTTQDLTATAGSDYVSRSEYIEIPPGQVGTTFDVTINGDVQVEGNEQFRLQGSNVSGAVFGDDQAIGTILNDEAVPNLTINDVSLNEGDSGSKLLTFTATLSAAATHATTFNASSANGTATAGSDYLAINLSGITIPAGQTSKTFSVTVPGDTLVEPTEYFYVNLSNAVGANITDGQGIGYIINNDGALISINDVAVGEGNAGTKVMTFTVSLSQAAPGPVSYNISTQGGDATAGVDYQALNLTNQVIPQGQLSKTHTVTINGDATIEPTEVFLIYVRQPSGASVWDGQGTGYILNDDGPTLSIPDASVGEGNSGSKMMNVTVQLSQAAATDVSFGISTQDVSASSSDYTGFNLSNQVIPAGQTSKVFQVPVAGDTTVEQNETFLVTLAANPVGATLYDRQAIATIYNDDGPTLSVNDASISEGNAGTKVLTFTVSLSQAAAAPVTYNIATSNLTATAGSDYVAKSLANESIPAGQTSKTFTVTINGDTAVESNETFRVTLSNISSNATLFKYTGTGTITNDD